MIEKNHELKLQERLQALVGLKLSIARNAADMKVFHFGPIRQHISGKGTVGTFAIHIQCPWRIVTDSAIVTGTSDRFFGPDPETDVDQNDTQRGSLQALRLSELLGGYDDKTRSFVNETDHLTVVSVNSDNYSGIDVLLSGGFRLQIFPDGSREEDWRFIDVGGDHLVIEGGQAASEPQNLMD